MFSQKNHKDLLKLEPDATLNNFLLAIEIPTLNQLKLNIMTIPCWSIENRNTVPRTRAIFHIVQNVLLLIRFTGLLTI